MGCCCLGMHGTPVTHYIISRSCTRWSNMFRCGCLCSGLTRRVAHIVAPRYGEMSFMGAREEGGLARSLPQKFFHGSLYLCREMSVLKFRSKEQSVQHHKTVFVRCRDVRSKKRKYHMEYRILGSPGREAKPGPDCHEPCITFCYRSYIVHLVRTGVVGDPVQGVMYRAFHRVIRHVSRPGEGVIVALLHIHKNILYYCRPRVVQLDVHTTTC